MTASWTAIVLVNWLWLLHLWHRRHHDHRLLVPFFSVYVFSDTLGFLISSPKFGGLDLVPLQRLLYPLWGLFATSIWLSWYLAPLIVAIWLYRSRIGWRVWTVTIIPLLLIATSQLFGLSPYSRRVLMHYVYEPIVLLTALILLGVYSWRKIQKGEAVDFLAFAAGWTAIMLALKVLLLFDANFKYQVLPSRAFFFIFMIITVVVYHTTPRIRKWLLLSN